jgi:DNA-binding transcriptional LysR family regulator
MLLDTITVQCFIAVAETKSFTKAADRIGRTQSAVSQQINKIENLLNKKLINREKEIHLTNEGEVFLNYAYRIFALHREALDRFKEPELQGELRFGLPEDFATVFLSDVLVDFSRIHPRIMLNIECDLTLNLLERFKKKEFDLVLVKLSSREDFPNGVEVLHESLEWVGNQELIKNFDNNYSIPLVLSPKPCVYRSRAIETLDAKNKKWRIVYSSPSYAGTIAAVKAGMGITVLPKTMIPEGLNILKNNNLPKLKDTHISLLKHNSNKIVDTFEDFVLKKL